MIDSEISKITKKEFEKRCKEIMKEYHPVRFIILEDDKKGIVALYRNKKIMINKIWKEKKKNAIQRSKNK
jgi:metallophosphoesterase superfamily enzyme